MADNNVKNRYAALLESTRVSSALNEDKHKEEYTSKIRSYYNNMQEQKRTEQLKAQGKSDDDIKIIGYLDEARKNNAAKKAAYEASKPMSAHDKSVKTAADTAAAMVGTPTGGGGGKFSITPSVPTGGGGGSFDTETSDTLKYLFGNNTPAGERLIENVVKTADKVVPEPVQYAARRGTLGTVGSLASIADTAGAIGKGIENAQNGGSFKSGFTNYLKGDANNQAYVEQQKEKVEAKRQDKPNVVTNALGDLAESFGYMIPSLAASAVSGAAGIPAALTKVVSATPLAANGFASGTREALKNGASENEALAYGALSALIESAGEYAIGGVLGKGGGLIDTGLKKLGLDLTKNIANPAVKSLVNYGKSALGEGAEEVIQEALSVGARRLTYDENARINAGELAYAGLLGSLMGGIGSLPSGISNTVSGARAVKDFKTIADNISFVAENGGINDAKTLADGMRTAWNGQIQAIEANKTYDGEQKELAAAPYKWMVQELDKLTSTLVSPEFKDAAYSAPATTEAVNGGELTKAEALEKNKNITDEIRNDNTLTTAEKKEYIDPIIAENVKINEMDDVRPDSGEFDDADGIREAMKEIAAEERAEATAKPEEVKAVEEPNAETVKPETETAEPVTEAQPLTESAESGTIEADEVPETVNAEEVQPAVEAEPVKEVALPEKEEAQPVPEVEQTVTETEEAAEPESAAESKFKNDTLDISTKKHTKTGADLIVGKLSRNLSKEEYAEFNKAVKAAGGYYSKYAGGFVFPNEESLDKLRDVIGINDMRTSAVSETAEAAVEAPQTAQKTQETAVEANTPKNKEDIVDKQTGKMSLKSYFSDNTVPINQKDVVSDKNGKAIDYYHGSSQLFDSFSTERMGGLINFTDTWGNAYNYSIGGGGGRTRSDYQNAVVLANSPLGVMVYEYNPENSNWVCIGKTSEEYFDYNKIDREFSATENKGTNYEGDDDLYGFNSGTRYENHIVGNIISKEKMMDYLNDSQRYGDDDYITMPKKNYLYKVNLKASNIFDTEDNPKEKAKIISELANVLRSYGTRSHNVDQIIYALNSDTPLWNTTKHEFTHREYENIIVPFLKSKGYDAIKYSDDGHDTIAVFDPQQVINKTVADPNNLPLETYSRDMKRMAELEARKAQESKKTPEAETVAEQPQEAVEESKEVSPQKSENKRKPLQIRVGDIVYLDNTAYDVLKVDMFDVELEDPTLIYPVTRSESMERLPQLLRRDERNNYIFERTDNDTDTKQSSNSTANIDDNASNAKPSKEDIDAAAIDAMFDDDAETEANNASEAGPYADRDIKEVGDRSVKAYMYENPEVKPFFQEAAETMLGDLRKSTKGERWFNSELYDTTGGEKGFGGTSRETTDDIAYLLDQFKYTYDDIEKGLNAIIEDHGSENNACSKRIEFLLHDRLYDGYNSFGTQIPYNEDYRNLIDNMPVTEYSKEAREKVMARDDTAAKSVTDTNSAPSRIADFVSGKLADGKPITRNELNTYAEETYGKKLADGDIDIKDINDAMELGMNRHLLSLKGDYTVDSLLKLTGLLPTQTNRTEDQIKLQQFSTPPAIAYTAAYAANIGKNDVVLEPSAGIGGIAVFAKNDGAKVHVNELDDRRLSIIKELPFDGFYNERGEQLHNILGDKLSPTVVVMNPPFSSSAVRNTKDIHEAAKHVESALKLLREGGRLVAITGRGMNMEAPAFRKWWDDIKSEYNVRANIGLDGKNYTKYGTSFDIQLIVIDKNGPTTEDVLKGKVDNVNELYNMIGEIRNERTAAEPVRPVSGTESDDVRRMVGEKAENEARNNRGTEQKTVESTPDTADKGSVSEVSDTERSAGASADTGRSSGKESAEPGGRTVGGNESADGRNLDEDRRGGSVSASDGESVDGRRDGGMGVLRGTDGELRGSDERNSEQSGEDDIVKRTVKQPKTELTEDKYEEYVPQTLTVKGAKKHPTKLVESAAMATVKAPGMTETLHLPKKIVTDGILSDAQLEAVTRAWQSFGKTLDSGETQGYFIGDGTGVGKGREIAGIMYESFLRGQDKAVWITKGSNLLTDAKRDLSAVIEGETPILQLEGGKKLAKLDKFNKGVLFATYDTVGKERTKKDSNLNGLVNWLGKDFDGVIAFDEAHQMGNATGAKTSRGRSKPAEKAVACIELQRMLPKAKIVYVSATGATEVTNLAYAERLGLWGMGTPFPSQEAFVSKIDAGGVAAMEVVARTLKARGQYIARSLSFEGVNYRRLTHNLDDSQRETYDIAAKSWQVVIQNFNKALEVTGGNLNTKAKSNAAQRIWNCEQQFFEQLTTSMMTPALIEDARKQLEAGKSVVVQLTRTNEAQAERETASAKKNEDGTLDLNETDFSCKGILEELVKNCFPVQEYEIVYDENGNKTSKPVEDSNKNPVLNAEAVKMRDALLAQIGQLTLPDAPIDMIYRGLGDDVVTENTGRKKRFGLDENGNTVIIKLPTNKDSFVRDFQDGRKRVIIFSEAGGTGKSYHADKNAKNQQQRIHYLLQPGWKANAAVQGFGRTLRSNQASAPEYVLMTTNVPAQARFISTIARRLDQLGALTKGQSNTGSQGIFNSSDNLEGEYARMSLRTLLSTLDRETLHEMGYDNLYNKQNQLNTSSEHLTNINRFLNRLFVLPLDKQPMVYGRFVSEMENRIQIAKDSGKYSDGVENYKAKRVEANSKTAADINSDYGTEVDYYVLDAYDDVVFNKFKDIKTKDDRFTGFYRTPRGKVRAVFSAGTIVDDKTLNKVNAYSTVSVAGRPVRLMQGDISAWAKIDASEAETLWKEETAEHPKESKTELHVVAGDLLQVWNQLPDTNISFKRILLDGGETIIGRVIPKKELDSTLRALNLDGKKQAYTAADAVKALNDGGFVQMAGGMRIERKRVANEYRYEFSGRIAPWQMATIKNQYGLFSEVIQYVNRYFIPTDKAESIIEKLSKSYPIQEVYSAKEADAEYSLAHDGIMSDDEYVQELIDNVVTPRGIKVVYEDMGAPADDGGVSYDALVSKPDMKIIRIGGDVPTRQSDKGIEIDRSAIIGEAKNNIDARNHSSTTATQKIVYAKDIDADILVNKAGLQHGISDVKITSPNTMATSAITPHIGEILENSIKTNELTENRNNVIRQYTLVGMARDKSGNYYIVRSIIHESDKNKHELSGVEVYHVLYGSRAQKITDLSATGYSSQGDPGLPPETSSSDTISISQLLDIVKTYYPDILSSDVLAHYGLTKSDISGTLQGSTKYSIPNAKYDPVTRTMYINKNAKRSHTSLIAHELYHSLSKEDQERLAYFFRQNTDENSAEFKAYKAERMATYSAKRAEEGKTFSDREFWKEYAAESCETLLTDKATIERLCGKSPSLGRRILDWIRDMWYRITGNSRYTTNRAVEAGKLSEKVLRKAALIYSDALGVKLNLAERQIVKSSVPEAIASDIGFGDDVGGINYSLEAGADVTDTPNESTDNVTMEQFNEDFESAKVVPKSDPWYIKGKNALGEMFAKLTRADSLIPEHGVEAAYYAPLRRQIIRIRDNFVRSQNSSLTDIMGMMTYTDEKGKRKALSKEEANKFTRLVYLNDLAETAKIQRERGEEVRLPKNYSEEDVHRLHDELMTTLTDTERAHINEALEKRAAVWKQLTSDYIKYNRMCGFDVSNRISRQAYYRHQVIDFMTDPQGHEKRYGKVAGMHLNDGRSFLKRRTGSERDINTDFASVEFLSLQQMHFDTEVAKALAKIKTKYDMKPEFVKRAKAENQKAIENLILREAREAMAADMRAKGQNVKDEDIDSLEPLMTVKNGKERYVSETYEQIMQYNRGMARSLSQLTQLALDGELDGYANTSGHRLALEQLKRGMMNETVFDFMSEFVSENDNEAAIAARVFFKNSALKRQFVEDTLGDKYMTWEKIAKNEGYVIFQPREGRYSYNTNALDEAAAKKLAEQIAATVAKDEAVNLSTEEWNAIISTYAKQIRVMGQPYEQWAVKPLVTQVLNKNAMEAIAAKVNSSSFVNLYLNALRHWKGWVTAGNILRAAKYHTRNIIGDLEATLTADPGIMRTVPKAYTEIRDMLKNGKETDTYREWLELGGDTNLIGIQEMTETERRKYLPMFAEDLSTPKKVIAAVTKPLDALSKYGEDLNRARESLLRYASYLYYKDKLTKSDGRVTDFVASNRNIINGLDTIEEKAYQLSADALGNYADISEFGRQIRRGLIPFYSFTESNLRRYYRFFANPIISIAQGDSKAQNVKNLAKRMATPAVSAIILALINGVLNREADEKLPEDVRNRPHITFGEWGGNVYAFTRIGNIPELLEWVGLDDWKWTEDDWQAPIDKMWDSITPAIKAPFELATGESRYSDFDQPSAIRDRWEYLFNTFGLSDVYKGVTGKPVKNGLWDTVQNMAVYKYDTMESAYWDTITNKRNWQNQAQTSVDPTPKSNALYYMKQAIRYGEADKAKKYMREYFKEGGTGKGIVTSINTMNPYYGFTSENNKEKGDEWVASLNEIEREKLESAVSYYNSYLAIPEAYKKKLNKADNTTAEALMNTYIDYVIGAQKAAGRK